MQRQIYFVDNFGDIRNIILTLWYALTALRLSLFGVVLGSFTAVKNHRIKDAINFFLNNRSNINMSTFCYRFQAFILKQPVINFIWIY
jgi:hypothetical protein